MNAVWAVPVRTVNQMQLRATVDDIVSRRTWESNHVFIFDVVEKYFVRQLIAFLLRLVFDGVTTTKVNIY